MLVRKTVKIPVHYKATEAKMQKLDSLTAKLTYCISMINSLVTKDIKLDVKTLQRLVDENGIAGKAKLSTGYVQQCRDKVLWSWRSYKALYDDWKYRYDDAIEELKNCGDGEWEKLEKRVKRLEKKEPYPPGFRHKTSCRLDHRTGKIQRGENSFVLWLHVSTLEKNKTMDVPLNPSYWHLKQLNEWTVKDFELVKKNGKYYAHVSLEREVREKPIISVGGMDQGLNRTIATVLLPPKEGGMPYEGLIKNELEELIGKYDDIIASVQSAGKARKLKQLRNKRANVSMYHDFCLARQVADLTEGRYMAIGNANFRRTQYRGNGMPRLRKRIGKWPYSRQRVLIALRRAERGYTTLLVDERYTSMKCCRCGSMLTRRKWELGSSYIVCHGCQEKVDADIAGATNIAYKAMEALRCRDERLKVRMNSVENGASA
jgi:putative transposase